MLSAVAGAIQPTRGRPRERCRRGRAPRCAVRVRLLCYAPRRRRWTTTPTRARTHARVRRRQRWEESFGRAGTAADNARAPLVQGKIYKGLHTAAAAIVHPLRGTLPPRRNITPAHQPPVAGTPRGVVFQPAADPCAVSAAETGQKLVEIELPRNSQLCCAPPFQRDIILFLCTLIAYCVQVIII